MLKPFLTFLLLVSICVANAQTDTCMQHSLLKREKFRLAFDTPNSSVLKKEELKLVLSNDQFSGYNMARGHYIASIPLLSVGTIYFAVGNIFVGMGLATARGKDSFFTEYFYFLISYISFGAASAFLIPGITLISYSAGKLNRIAKGYNSQYKLSYQPVKLHFGVVGSGIGLKLTF